MDKKKPSMHYDGFAQVHNNITQEKGKSRGHKTDADSFITQIKRYLFYFPSFVLL